MESDERSVLWVLCAWRKDKKSVYYEESFVVLSEKVTKTKAKDVLFNNKL